MKAKLSIGAVIEANGKIFEVVGELPENTTRDIRKVLNEFNGELFVFWQGNLRVAILTGKKDMVIIFNAVISQRLTTRIVSNFGKVNLRNAKRILIGYSREDPEFALIVEKPGGLLELHPPEGYGAFQLTIQGVASVIPVEALFHMFISVPADQEMIQKLFEVLPPTWGNPQGRVAVLKREGVKIITTPRYTVIL